MKKSIFAIEGMHCASCVMRNEKALKKVPGVAEASVNFALKRAAVTYDETQASEHDLLEAVRGIGYKAVPTTNDQRPLQPTDNYQKHENMDHGEHNAAHSGGEHVHHTEAKGAKKKSVLALVLAFPVAVMGMSGVEFGAEIYGHALSMWGMAVLGSAVILFAGWQ